MNTTTPTRGATGISLTPDPFTPTTAELDHLTVHIRPCPNGGLYHTDPECGRMCTTRCNHPTDQDLTAQQKQFGDVDGQLCTCADDIGGLASQLGQPLTAARTLADIIGVLHTQIDRTTKALNDGSTQAAEQALLHLLEQYRWLKQDSEAVNATPGQQQHIHQLFSQTHTTVRQLQQQLTEEDDTPLLRRLLTTSIVPDDPNGWFDIDDTDRMLANIDIVRQADVPTDTPLPTLVCDLGRHWKTAAADTNYSPQQAADTIAAELVEHGTQPDAATRAAQQLVSQWDTTLNNTLLQHAGRPRLVALSPSGMLNDAASARERCHAALRGFVARHVPPTETGERWTIHIIDQAACVGLHDLAIIEIGGNAQPLYDHAKQCNVNLDTALQAVNSRYRNSDEPIDGLQLRNAVKATITALAE